MLCNVIAPIVLNVEGSDTTGAEPGTIAGNIPLPYHFLHRNFHLVEPNKLLDTMGCGSCGTKKPGGCKSNGGCSSGGCNRLNVHDWLHNLP
ncbi:MAG: hypothetical protein ACK4ON_12870, partial [Bacteroidia bacterium]